MTQPSTPLSRVITAQLALAPRDPTTVKALRGVSDTATVITLPLPVSIRALQFCFHKKMCAINMLAAGCGAECLAMTPLRACDELLCWHPKIRPRFNA